MRAAIHHGPRDIRVEDVPEPELDDPTDALVRVTHTAVCGSDLWFYRGDSDRDIPSAVGHEPMGIVEAVGDDVRSVDPGDRVFAPFKTSCGSCQLPTTEVVGLSVDSPSAVESTEAWKSTFRFNIPDFSAH